MTNAKKYNLGWIAMIVLSLIPFLIWLLMKPLALRFSDFGQAGTSLGQIFGLTGMAMFALVIILSSRLKYFEDYFGGMNQVYIAHHFFGGLAFCLLLFHPLLLAYRFLLISTHSAALFLIPSLDNIPIAYGRTALIVMFVLLFITFYLKIRYQVWKFSHKFLGLAFLFASLHALFITSDISRNLFLKFYIIGLAVLALLTFVYRTILGKYLVRRNNYIIDSANALAEGVTEICLKTTGEAIRFEPGQFVFISFIGPHISSEVHPFTISGGVDSNLKFTIKSLGDFTGKIDNLRPGMTAKVEGPFGRFNFKNYENKNQVWVAGGIGLTPFLSMARSLNKECQDFKIDFFYSVNRQSELLFVSEFNKIRDANPNFKVTFWTFEDRGFLTAKKIDELSINVKNSDIFLCGPPAMMQSLRKQFIEIGIKNKNIHSEEFQL